MNEEIREFVKNPMDSLRDVSIILDPQESINALVMRPPVTWKGRVGQKPVEIVQLSTFARSYDDVDFKEFPKEYEWLKGKIIDLIDDALKRND
jgi:hypothetical protein